MQGCMFVFYCRQKFKGIIRVFGGHLKPQLSLNNIMALSLWDWCDSATVIDLISLFYILFALYIHGLSFFSLSMWFRKKRDQVVMEQNCAKQKCILMVILKRKKQQNWVL